jgi:hypothetical protein
MLILAAGDRGLPMDYDELERWMRIGFERVPGRGMGSGKDWLAFVLAGYVCLRGWENDRARKRAAGSAHCVNGPRRASRALRLWHGSHK